MTDKSHVGMGYHLCPICGTKHDEVVLLDKRLRPTLERESFVGFKLCPEHDKMKGEYLALVELKGTPTGKTIVPTEAHNRRTGQFAHLRRTVVKDVLNVDIPSALPYIYVDEGVIPSLQAMQSPDKETLQ